MKLNTTAMALVFAVSAAPVAAQYGAPPPPPPRPQLPSNIPTQSGDNREQAQPADDGKVHPSKGAVKAIVELQKAVNANDTANIPALVTAANAVATTKDDKYIIGQLRLKAAYAANDDAALASAIDAVAASGFVDTPTMADLYVALGSKLYNAKKFDLAATAFEHATTLSPANSQALINLAESRFSQGRKADAAALFQRAIQGKLAAGQKPEEALYKRAWSIAYGEQAPTAIDLGRQWISAYPSATSWRNGLATYLNIGKTDVESALDTVRLMRATGSLTAPEDYSLYATAAAEQLNYNEAQVVIDQGLANKQIDPSSPVFREIISGLKAKQKATEADLIQAQKDAKDGKAFVRIGDRYYAMGNYAKAAELYRLSIGKAGVDSNVANMHLGMALAQSGDKAGATTALNAVSGSLTEIAKYWLIYVQQRA